MESFDFHGARAALRGNPSFVWRAGQNRRLEMIVHWGALDRAAGKPRVLVDGCGVGMYVNALQPYGEIVAGIDIEHEHLEIAVDNAPAAALSLAAAETLPFADGEFDLVLSHEVLEHVLDDRRSAAEIARVLRPGGRAVIFAPNRLYPFETHGIYWGDNYWFGNMPLVNYLPDVLRNRLAPHVRVYTATGLRHLFAGQPVRVIHHTQIFPGYDNVMRRWPAIGAWLRRITYRLEHSPLTVLGLSHLLVVEKVADR